MSFVSMRARKRILLLFLSQTGLRLLRRRKFFAGLPQCRFLFLSRSRTAMLFRSFSSHKRSGKIISHPARAWDCNRLSGNEKAGANVCRLNRKRIGVSALPFMESALNCKAETVCRKIFCYAHLRMTHIMEDYLPEVKSISDIVLAGEPFIERILLCCNISMLWYNGKNQRQIGSDRGMAVKIRHMQILDYDSVYNLWLSCPGMGLNDLDDSREGIARYLARNPTTCFVATEQGCIIGAILAGHDGRRGYISHTAVSPAYQRRGIGKQLVGAALTALKAQGINKVNLVVFAHNEQGNAFWEKMGFTERPDLIYRNRTLVEMVRIDT